MFKFDICCFQECFYGLTNYKGKLVKYGLEAGLIHMVTGKSPGFFSHSLIDSGLMIFSRYPIVETDFCKFKNFLMIDMVA